MYIGRLKARVLLDSSTKPLIMANLHEGSNDEPVPQCCLCKEKPNWILIFLVLLMLYQLLTVISVVSRAFFDSGFLYPFYSPIDGSGAPIGMVVGLAVYMLLVNVWIGRATFRYYQYLRKKTEKQEMQL
jgi:hypothetical protein